MKKLIFLAVLTWSAAAVSAQNFTLSSKDLGGQFTTDFIANNFGCNGANKSPELHWENVPAGTKSFAVTMFDMDAPTGSGFWHWVVIDIPSGVTQLKRGAGSTAQLSPAMGLQRINDTGTPGYLGPCPGEAEGAHRYIITVYALGTEKTAAETTAPAALTSYLLNKTALSKASIIAYCKR